MDALILTPDQYARFFEGVQVTLMVLLYSFILGVILSLVFGVLRLNDRAWVRGAALVFVEFARGISSIILLFIMAIAVPILVGIPQGNLLNLAAIALGINMGGYGAEIIRGAILSVPKGQTEASIALNLTSMQRLRYVILPQAMRVILPPMGNLTIEILKGTALVSLIGLVDITYRIDTLNTSQAISGAGGGRVDYFVFALNALVMYFIIAQVINAVFRLLERRVERSYAGGEAGPRDGQLDQVAGAGAN